jgi:DNA invertase Pin-like site-specific DNA recombinase
VVSERYRLVGYVRVSDTKGREDTLISPELQREQITGYATTIPADVVTWREELDISGTTLARPQFIEAVEMVERGEVDGLIVAKINRFARSTADAGAIVRRIEKAGGIFVSAPERYDPTPTGRVVRTLFFAMAELEADTIRENWSQAQRNAISKGKHVSPWIPAGFVKPGKGEPMVPHPDYAPLIVEAFERRRTGADFSAIAAFLTEHGVPKSKGSANWTGAEVRRMLARRVYIGELHHGEHRTVHNDLALVDRHTWDAVQAMHTSRPPRSRRRAYLLSGVSRCAGCGYSLKPYSASAAMVAKGSAPDYHYYRCSKHHAGGTCPAPASAPGRALDEYVTEWFYALIEARSYGSAVDVEELHAAERAVANAEADLEMYVTLESALGEHYLIGLKAKKQVLAERRMAVAVARTKVGGGIPTEVELRSHFMTWPIERRREAIASVVGCVMVRRMPRLSPVEERARIIPLDEMGSIVLPGKGSPTLRPYSFDGEPATAELVSQ